MQTGKQSVTFSNPVYITHAASVVGSKEGQGPLGNQFDLVVKDDMLNQDSWEEAESPESFAATKQRDRLELTARLSALTASKHQSTEQRA